MTAPTEEVVEQDQARDEGIHHIFCAACVGTRSAGRFRALCGTVAHCGGRRYFGPTPEDCFVCAELGEQRNCERGHRLW